MNVKSWFVKRKDQWAASISRFPLAIALLVAIVILTIMTIYTEGDSDYINQILSLGLGVMLLVAIQLFSEIKSLKSGLVWGIKAASLILPLLYYFYLRQAPSGFNQSGSIRTTVMYFILAVLLLVVPTLKTRLTFSDSLIIFIKAVFSSLLIAIILFIGISAILSAYTTLIYELDYRWFAYNATVVYLFVAPVYLLSRLPVFDEDTHADTITKAKSIPQILEILIAFIIIPVLLVFSAILIAYILINITGEFWKDNLMEPMLISYTVVGIVTLFLAENVDKKITRLFSQFYPYLLLVVAVFQTVSSSLKTADFGLTHGRYFVLLFGIFSIVSTIIYSFMKSKKRFIPFLLMGLGLISILPVIDAVSIGIRNQLSQAEALVEPHLTEDGTVPSLEEEITDEEKARFSYSMNYLNEQDQLDQMDWLPENFEYYRDFDNTFGFDSSYHYYYGSDTDFPGPSGPDQPGYAFIELDFSQPLNLSLSDVDELVEVSTYQGSPIDIDLDTEPYSLVVTADPDDFNVELLEDGTSLLNYDLSFIRENIWEENQTDPQRSLEDMRYTEENDEARLTVIIRRLEVEEGAYLQGEFIILVTYK